MAGWLEWLWSLVAPASASAPAPAPAPPTEGADETSAAQLEEARAEAESPRLELEEQVDLKQENGSVENEARRLATGESSHARTRGSNGALCALADTRARRAGEVARVALIIGVEALAPPNAFVPSQRVSPAHQTQSGFVAEPPARVYALAFACANPCLRVLCAGTAAAPNSIWTHGCVPTALACCVHKEAGRTVRGPSRSPARLLEAHRGAALCGAA
jgi:hypothetical protein